MKTLLFALSFLSTVALAQDLPNSFAIKSIRTNGDACRPGSASINISDDREAFTVSLNDFVAELGPQVAGTERMKSCRLVFDTEQDAGWEFALLAVTARGFVHLDEGVTGRQTMSFDLKGNARDTVQDLTGPLDQDYSLAYQVPMSSLKWSGCPASGRDRLRDLTLETRVTLKSRDAQSTGLYTVDTIDGQLEQIYELVWRQCGGTRERHVALCSVTGNDGRRLTVKAQGKSAEAAQNKLRKKLAQRCSKAGSKFGNCNQSAAQCSVFQLR